MLGPVRQEWRGTTQATFFPAEGAPAEYRIEIDRVSPPRTASSCSAGGSALREGSRWVRQEPCVIWPGFADSRAMVSGYQGSGLEVRMDHKPTR